MDTKKLIFAVSWYTAGLFVLLCVVRLIEIQYPFLVNVFCCLFGVFLNISLRIAWRIIRAQDA